MKFLIFSTFFFAFISITCAAIETRILRDKEFPGKCVINKTTILSMADEMKDPNSPCARIFCGRNGLALVYTCDEVAPPTACEFGDYVDISKNYPDCCTRKLSCDEK